MNRVPFPLSCLFASVLAACADDVPLPLTASSLVTGGTHTCAIGVDDTLYCWGANDRGQLGLGVGDLDGHPRPHRVTGVLRFDRVSAGLAHTCALTSSGAAYCWGSNFSGQLGDGTGIYRAEPTPVVGELRFATISAGAFVTCALTAVGEAYCWGDAPAVGVEDTSGFPQCSAARCSNVPVRVSGGYTFSHVSAGGTFACGLTTTGATYCWGTNYMGQLGIGSRVNHLAPIAVAPTLTFSTISAGTAHTCGVTTEGSAYCWGFNQYGELGNGTEADTTLPVPVSGGLAFRSIHAGGFHTCGVTPDSSAFCWGFGLDGQLGNDSWSSIPHPSPVRGGLRFADVVVSASGHHSCGLLSTGATYCWGSDGFGQLGDGTAGGHMNRPLRVEGPQ